MYQYWIEAVARQLPSTWKYRRWSRGAPGHASSRQGSCSMGLPASFRGASGGCYSSAAEEPCAIVDVERGQHYEATLVRAERALTPCYQQDTCSPAWIMSILCGRNATAARRLMTESSRGAAGDWFSAWKARLVAQRGPCQEGSRHRDSQTRHAIRTQYIRGESSWSSQAPYRLIHCAIRTKVGGQISFATSA